MKECNNCGVLKSLSEFYIKGDNRDGRMNDCMKCRKIVLQRWRRDKANGYSRGGGPYRLVYDPLDSFTSNSSFKRTEIAEMLNSEYLAIGTRFRNDGKEFEVSAHGNTGALKLSECNRR